MVSTDVIKSPYAMGEMDLSLKRIYRSGTSANFAGPFLVRNADGFDRKRIEILKKNIHVLNYFGANKYL